MGAPATFPGRAKPEPGTQRGASRLGGRVKPGHDGRMGANLPVIRRSAGALARENNNCLSPPGIYCIVQADSWILFLFAFSENDLVAITLAAAIAGFGKSAKAKLNNPALTGAPEDQLRAPLEALFRELASLSGLAPGAVTLVGETTLAHLNSRPDYAVTVNDALAGFIEVKAPGKGADPRRFSDAHDKAQWQKLKLLPNVLYTDGGSFTLWRDGEIVGKPIHLDGDVETAGAKLAAPPEFLPLVADFLNWQPVPPKTPRELAKITARLCRLLRDEVQEQLARENVGLRRLAFDWRALLFPKADDEQFADGYAQAVTFGLLIARANDIELKEGVEFAALKLKRSSSLIGTALSLLTEDPQSRTELKTPLDTLARVLDQVNWKTIAKDDENAWLYFYENFLEVYDNKRRKETGSYYTPPEVVDAMTRLVDEALRGPLFNRRRGLASPDVTIADPAVGTGTFILGALRKVAENIADDQGEGAVAGELLAAAKRIYGFELQFGPFAVAQLRILAELQALAGVSANTAHMNLYITDTLGNPFVEDEQLPQIVEPVARSRREANRVKRGQPITVVIGNPPYKNKAAGLGGWIEQGSEGRAAPMELWSPPVDWGVGAHTHHLKNLYVYFWRWATLKVFGSGWNAATGEAEQQRPGIICYITAAGFLGGDGFGKMRAGVAPRRLASCGSSTARLKGHQPDVPTRIFQGVQQPVCIVIAARTAAKDRAAPAEAKYMAMPRGRRDDKFAALAADQISTMRRGARRPRAGASHSCPKAARRGRVFLAWPPLFAWSVSGRHAPPHVAHCARCRGHSNSGGKR
jgi:hypothetical protein